VGLLFFFVLFFFFSSRRRHTRSKRDWSSDVCSSDLGKVHGHGHSRRAVFISGRELFRDLGEAEGDGVPDGLRRVRLETAHFHVRSEERRVGKECRSWRRTYQERKMLLIQINRNAYVM